MSKSANSRPFHHMDNALGLPVVDAGSVPLLIYFLKYLHLLQFAPPDNPSYLQPLTLAQTVDH